MRTHLVLTSQIHRTALCHIYYSLRDLHVIRIALPSMMLVRRCTRSWEGAWPGQLTQTIQIDIPYHNMACSVYKLGEFIRWERDQEVMIIASVSDQQAMVLCIIFSPGFYSSFSFSLLFFHNSVFSSFSWLNLTVLTLGMVTEKVLAVA